MAKSGEISCDVANKTLKNLDRLSVASNFAESTANRMAGGENLVDAVAGGFNDFAVGAATDYGLSKLSRIGDCFCFVAGTPVLTAAGLVAIETVEVGDIVIATDPETGETAEKEVLHTFVNETDELVHLTVNGEEITCTPGHKFYAPEKGWTSAIDLRAGDILQLVNGEYVTVEAVQHEILEFPVKTYNFEVDDFHTYYVGEQSVLVHNKGCGADFYVTPDGVVVPSTGYRYISESAPYLDEMTDSMSIPANPNGTYFSFDNFDVANPGALQVPHDASVKVEFDTLQIIDDIETPHGDWGKASYLEPITHDFPEYGPGGATQAITHSEIQIDNITKLPK